MLQIAFGGYHIVEDNVSEFVETPIFYEPQFNIMVPLEIEISQADRFYLVLRKRANAAGTTFEDISVGDIEITIKDATNNANITANISANGIYDGWDSNPSSFLPLVITVNNALDMINPATRVRAIDCFVKDTTDKDFITFRVLVGDDDKFFHYIPIQTTNMADRYKYTAIARIAYVTLKRTTDTYVLFSPYAYLSETNKANAEFSYPANSIYYKRQKTYNDEDFEYSIGSYGHPFVPENISLMNVPGYEKAAVLLIDNHMYAELEDVGTSSYIDVSITGRVSQIADTFRVNFIR